ncbi:MAG: hypothetical protein JWQ27_102 [Ferruginibacter sp.]|nr:hypothetical protein [Ferruginibacter sp.]
MHNARILENLVKQRDRLFNELAATTVSELSKSEYIELKAGRLFVFDSDEREMLQELKRLSKETKFDAIYLGILEQYGKLNNDKLVNRFIPEMEKLLHAIVNSGKMEKVQAIFIEYDYYYHYTSSINAYGIHSYPIIEEPRYLTDEIDELQPVLFLADGINFEPAWISCEALEPLEQLDVEFDMQRLFQLHSRVLLHQALAQLQKAGKLELLQNRPFTFYINEHDCEVMTLYRLEN